MRSSEDEPLSPEKLAAVERREAILQVSLKALDESKKRCLMTLGFYIIALVIIGTPLWWITTSPYRATLEYFDDFESDEMVRSHNVCIASYSKYK